MTTTTLRRIRAHHPCTLSWRRLCRAVGGMRAYGLDTPISLVRVLDVLGLADAIWACRTLDAADLPRLAEFARRVAARVEDLRSTAAEPASASAYYAVRAAVAAAVGAAADAADAADAAYAAAEWGAERDAQAAIFREIFA